MGSRATSFSDELGQSNADNPVVAVKVGNRRRMLRLATAAAHHALEAKIGRVRDLQAYHRYLVGMEAFRRDEERGLGHFCAVQWPHWRPTLLTAHLVEDLRDLGLARRPCKHISNGENTIENVIGILYALEGSSLGARILANDAKNIGLHSDYGARHLYYQTASSSSWKGYLYILEYEVNLQMERVITAAKATFGRAGHVFDEVGYDFM